MKNYKNLGNNKKAFTLVELIIVISILIIIATIWMIAFDTQGANDTKRVKTVSDIKTYLEDFKSKYWVYPNTSATGRRYPTSWCGVSGYDSLISCFVAKDIIVEDSETYNDIAYDPTEWEFNEFDQEYAYYYGTSNRGNKFKVCTLMWKQDNDIDYKWLDWNDAVKWSRYKCITSPNTKLTDVTSMNK